MKRCHECVRTDMIGDWSLLGVCFILWKLLKVRGLLLLKCLIPYCQVNDSTTLMYHPRKVQGMAPRKIHGTPRCQLSAPVSELTPCPTLRMSIECLNPRFCASKSEITSSLILRRFRGCLNARFCASIHFEQCKPDKASRWGWGSAPQVRPALGKKGSVGIGDPIWLAGSATAQEWLEVLCEILGC